MQRRSHSLFCSRYRSAMKNDVDGKVVATDGGVMREYHVATPNHDQGDARLDPLSKVKSTFRQPLVSKNILDPALYAPPFVR